MRRMFDSFSIGMMKIARFFLFLAIFVVIMFFVGRKFYDVGYKLFYEGNMYNKNHVSKTVDIVIDKKDTWEKVANTLKKEGIIDDEKIFQFRAKIYKTKLTPGHYQFNTKQSMKNILDKIDEGEIVSTQLDESAKQNENIAIENNFDNKTNKENNIIESETNTKKETNKETKEEKTNGQ